MRGVAVLPSVDADVDHHVRVRRRARAVADDHLVLRRLLMAAALRGSLRRRLRMDRALRHRRQRMDWMSGMRRLRARVSAVLRLRLAVCMPVALVAVRALLGLTRRSPAFGRRLAVAVRVAVAGAGGVRIPGERRAREQHDRCARGGGEAELLQSCHFPPPDSGYYVLLVT